MARFRRCVLTGASGFIGRHVLARLINTYEEITVLGRNAPPGLPSHVRFMEWDLSVPQLQLQDLSVFRDADVFHLAAVAHRRIAGNGNREALIAANATATKSLARMAHETGADHFIFMSSIGVLGTDSGTGAFSETDPYAPTTVYGESKQRAEEGLMELASKSGLSVTVIRPPVVYGTNAPGNFGLLVKAAKAGIPLPLASIHNARHMVGIDNLVDALQLVAENPSGKYRVFHIADDEAFSTPKLYRLVASAMGRKGRLFPFPVSLLRSVSRLLGRPSLGDALTANLRIDSRRIRETLGWRAARSAEDGLLEYLGRHRVD